MARLSHNMVMAAVTYPGDFDVDIFTQLCDEINGLISFVKASRELDDPVLVQMSVDQFGACVASIVFYVDKALPLFPVNASLEFLNYLAWDPKQGQRSPT